MRGKERERQRKKEMNEASDSEENVTSDHELKRDSETVAGACSLDLLLDSAKRINSLCHEEGL